MLFRSANLPKPYLNKYFKEQKDGQWLISRDLVEAVEFSRVNLSDVNDTRKFRDIDVIFCRNLLIYFDKQTQATVLKRLCSHLRTGGYLFLGHSETIVGVDLPVRTVSGTVFQKV